MKRALAVSLVIVLLAACTTKPAQPDWQVNASSALDRYVKAYMLGDTRVEGAEFARARSEVQSTGQPALVARAELTRCAAQVASLVFEPCVGFEKLRADAPAAERAYADFLGGRIAPPDVALLPAQYRGVAGAQGEAAGLRAIEDPLSRLIASGVLMRAGRATPDVLDAAVDTASHQGWRRPLLAWLGAQLLRAERAGAKDEALRLRRRIALVAGQDG